MTNNSSIHGIGNDIIAISRMRQSVERHGHHFLNRLFTQKEQDYCYKFQDPVPHFAGRFAAKDRLNIGAPEVLAKNRKPRNRESRG